MAAAVLVGLVAYAWIADSPSTPTRHAQAAPTQTRSSTRPTGSSAPRPLPTATRLEITAQIKPGGDVLVDERLTWPSAPGTGPLTFGLPSRLDGAGLPDGAVAQPVVTALRVSSNGLTIVPEPLEGARWTVKPPVTQGQLTLDVSYHVTGVALRSVPAPAGRATVVIVAMLRDLARAGAVTVAVTGPVLGLDCPLATLSERVCGEQAGTGWSAAFPAGHTAGAQLVTAQVDLPT